jgi:uncharacterized membrane protein YphA (DoxX/SURF4 family)
MLSIFPGILFLAPLAVTLLRVTAGLTMLYASYRLFDKRGTLSRIKFPIIGHPATGLLVFGALATFVIGGLLFVGLYTQVAAILGVLGALKYGFYYWYADYSPAMPLSIGTSILLAVICLALIFTGAGAFAFDLPL